MDPCQGSRRACTWPQLLTPNYPQLDGSILEAKSTTLPCHAPECTSLSRPVGRPIAIPNPITVGLDLPLVRHEVLQQVAQHQGANGPQQHKATRQQLGSMKTPSRTIDQPKEGKKQVQAWTSSCSPLNSRKVRTMRIARKAFLGPYEAPGHVPRGNVRIMRIIRMFLGSPPMKNSKTPAITRKMSNQLLATCARPRSSHSPLPSHAMSLKKSTPRIAVLTSPCLGIAWGPNDQLQ